MEPVRIGIIGGSGLYRMEGLTDTREHVADTPFGAPSDALLLGKLHGVDVAFLARHGRSHALIPSQIPFRANIYAMKALGVQYLLSVSAVGSMREEIAPLHMVLPDQFIDLTRKREGTFFGDGAVAHVSLADPVEGIARRRHIVDEAAVAPVRARAHALKPFARCLGAELRQRQDGGSDRCDEQHDADRDERPATGLPRRRRRQRHDAPARAHRVIRVIRVTRKGRPGSTHETGPATAQRRGGRAARHRYSGARIYPAHDGLDVVC